MLGDTGVFTDMENWAEIRRRVLVDGLGKCAACSEYDIHGDTLRKVLDHAERPDYRRTAPQLRSKLGPFPGVIHQILKDDRKAPKKQRHTTVRIFGRLPDEHGYEGRPTVVKQAVADWRRRSAEVFVPLAHLDGHGRSRACAGTRRPPTRGWPTTRWSSTRRPSARWSS